MQEYGAKVTRNAAFLIRVVTQLWPILAVEIGLTGRGAALRITGAGDT